MRRETNLSELTHFKYGKGTPTRKTSIDRFLEKTAWEAARLRAAFKIAEEQDLAMLVRPGPMAFTPEALAGYFRKVVGADWVIIYPAPNLTRQNHTTENENHGQH